MNFIDTKKRAYFQIKLHNDEFRHETKIFINSMYGISEHGDIDIRTQRLIYLLNALFQLLSAQKYISFEELSRLLSQDSMVIVIIASDKMYKFYISYKKEFYLSVTKLDDTPIISLDYNILFEDMWDIYDKVYELCNNRSAK